MGAYAVPSNQPFVAKKPIRTKRKPGVLEEKMKFFNGTQISLDEKTGELVLKRDNKVIGVFTEEDE